MNYYIEKDDMEIILDVLENLVSTMTTSKAFGISNRRPYSIEDVDGLFQTIDNSGGES